MKHCEKKKLTKRHGDKYSNPFGRALTYECVCSVHHTELQLRKDLYDPSIRKYLVLVRDDVESAEEKLQELQQEMAQMGLLSSDFELGDLVEELDGEGNPDSSKPQPAAKKRLAEYPPVEGEESVQEYLGQYRRAILSRKALLKGARERLEKEGSKGHELLASTVCLLSCTDPVLERPQEFVYCLLLQGGPQGPDCEWWCLASSMR